MWISEYKGVFFIEGTPTEASVKESFSSELNSFFSQNQLKTLDHLKEKMATYALERGCNSVVDFKYGQRSTFWKSILGMDNVMWYGSGKVAEIDPVVIAKYKKAKFQI